jgi:tricorn protease
MKKSYVILISMFLLMVIIPVKLFGINTNDTRMMSQPAISANHIAFIYAEDLWIANTDGSQPRRLTVDEGIESDPYFSPDGSLIAFSVLYRLTGI